MLAFFQRLARPRMIAALLLPGIIFPAVILPAAEAQIRAYLGGVGVIDLRFGYTPEVVFGMVETYEKRGGLYIVSSS